LVDKLSARNYNNEGYVNLDAQIYMNKIKLMKQITVGYFYVFPAIGKNSFL